ncbi:hypothetical protein [Actinomadura opuntiae]|uniref:hypothetical protein n=1 Tax=Actinomadura sp. OS1-43 TaxID=604315 RepID=UPI00255A873B|nr:hypothetical protein [Actinomadura sp. OS1-43]MDL4813065.1 hypothetical protein [Actinomadura sp. OS1-43]
MADDLNATQLARATRIMQTYEQRAFPGGSSLLNRDPLYAQALLSALINDLEHYATQHNLNFTEIIISGRTINPQNPTETDAAAPHKVGDEVRLLRHGDRCGTIVGWTNSRSETETTFLVEVPGIPAILAAPAAHLAPAPPFPRTATALGMITHADEAERAYTTLASRHAATASDRAAARRDCDNLIEALSSWSGVPAHQLRPELDPKPPPPAPSGHPRDTAAAARDFPYDLTQGIPPASEPNPNPPTKQTKPRQGPNRAS